MSAGSIPSMSSYRDGSNGFMSGGLPAPSAPTQGSLVQATESVANVVSRGLCSPGRKVRNRRLGATALFGDLLLSHAELRQVRDERFPVHAAILSVFRLFCKRPSNYRKP